MNPLPSDRPQPALADAEILPMLPPHGPRGLWTFVIANTLNLASPGRCLKPRLIFNALVRLEQDGRVARDGRPGSYLYTGWMLAKPQH